MRRPRLADPARAAVLLPLAVALALALALASGCSRPDPRFLGSGTIDAREVTLSANFGGQIMSLTLHEGEDVKAGEVLGRIDTARLAAQLDELSAQGAQIVAKQAALAASTAQLAAKQAALDVAYRRAKTSSSQVFASYRLARANLGRVRALFAGGGTTREQLDTVTTADVTSRDALTSANLAFADLSTQRQGLAAERQGLVAQRLGLSAELRQLAAQRELIGVQLHDASIIAPTPGVIEKKFVEPGETAGPGTPICAIADLSDMWVRVYLDEKTLARISVGSHLVVDAMGKPFDGVVEAIAPDAEFTPKQVETRDVDATLVWGVKVRITNPGAPLRIGMPVRVRLP